MDDELKRHIAELEGKVRELEARWAEVPWPELRACAWSARRAELWQAPRALEWITDNQPKDVRP